MPGHGHDETQCSRGRRRWPRWLWPVVGLASLVWFLVRVVPKPSRASYPCQRAAFPLACSFVAWLLGVVGFLAAFRRARRHWRQARLVLAGLCLAAAVAAGLWAFVLSPGRRASAAFTPSEGANNPMGTAKGIHPGRVVWVHDPTATDWDGYTGFYWQDAHIDQTALDRMLSRSLRWLTAQSTDAAAWDALFRHFNQAHGKGNVGYQTTERVTIKINLNNCGSYSTTNNQVDTSPQMTRALLRSLVNTVGVPQDKITVFDSVRRVAQKIWDSCHGEFPNVRFEDVEGSYGRYRAAPDPNTLIHYGQPIGGTPDHVPACCVQADYLINAAALKGHSLAGVTLCGKNLFGSLCESPSHLHFSVEHRYGRPMGSYSGLVDLLGHQHLDSKCLLFVIEGLYGAPYQSGTPERWPLAPFNNDWPSSLFVSQDPIAIDSVGLDFLRARWDLLDNCEDYLHEAAQANNPPSGIFYDPEGDGTRLASLGVHEHWNNSTDKKYTRNLGTGDGIELVGLSNTPPQVDAGSDADIEIGSVANLHAAVSAGGLPGLPGAVTIQWGKASGIGDVTFEHPAALDTTATFTEPGTYVLRLTATDGHIQGHDDVTITVRPVPPPGDLDVDLRVMVAAQFNHEAPAPGSLCLRSLELNGNPPDRPFAIRVEPGGWLRLDGTVTPTCLRADGAQPEWHTAAEWAGKRLRGLDPGTAYIFHGKAKNAALFESALVEVSTCTTNKPCDVNRSSLVTALDYAYIKKALLDGGSPGTTAAWAFDINDDGVINVTDLSLTRFQILNPGP